jgi:phosphatidylethanolamine/phosphatidyl-N-methylethanolamine N-methyltransferase
MTERREARTEALAPPGAEQRLAARPRRSMELHAVRSAYRRYAAIYDLVFGSIFEPGRRLAVRAANSNANQRILEVGVGTGLSLPMYRSDAKVMGIDVSPEMLAKARERTAALKLRQVESLVEMDAERLRFPDASFDSAVALYVVSVVPDPIRLLSEMRRVCRPGGDIVILNHFGSDRPLLRTFESAFAPLSGALGFRPNMPIGNILNLPGLETVSVQSTNLFGYWTMLHLRRL